MVLYMEVRDFLPPQNQHYLKVTKFSGILNLAILAFFIFSLNLVCTKPVKCMAN